MKTEKKKKEKFNSKDWQGRRRDQVEANYWMFMVAVTIGLIALLCAFIGYRLL